MSFQVLINQIFLNIFVAIIVEAFNTQTKALELPVQHRDIETFAETWKDLDPNATGQISVAQLRIFIDKMIAKDSQLLSDEVKQNLNLTG